MPAVAAYREHFARGGNSPEAAFELARILESRGQIQEAKEFYTRALLAKTQCFTSHCHSSYVNMFSECGQFAEAKKLIEDVRGRSDTAKYFMAKEF